MDQTRMPKAAELRQGWMLKVKGKFKESPLGSNVFFGTILVCLENITDTEFSCPCKVPQNLLFSAAYFIIPAAVVFLLMVNIQSCRSKTCSKAFAKNVVSSLVVAIFWVIIVFWDGKGFVCAMTDWSGNYVELNNTSPKKWCRPTNKTTSQACQTKIREWYFYSQGIAWFLIILLMCGYICRMCSTKDVKGDPEAASPARLTPTASSGR
ncbi:hypothetical protein ABVT39_004980 [Epinephelus coioides]